MKKNYWILIVAAAVAVSVYFFWPEGEVSGNYDEFARCLSSKGAIMYGAYWCPHCQNEKKAFGDSFRFVDYVECTQETKKCLAEKINGYPTWTFPDGRRFEGELGLEKLSELSGCLLEKDTTGFQSSPQAREGTALPVGWGDLGAKMISVGVIDAEKFESLYAGSAILDDDARKLLYETDNGNLEMTQKNSGVILNLLWALGLGNKNDVLDFGPMKDPRYGGAGNFASTGGWILAKGDAMEHYSRHPFMILTEEQQKLVERVAKNVYRPCCSNSTYFPDCNHGMAMLGFLELMASQGVGEKEMYDYAAKVNAYWFPELNQNAGSSCAV